MAAGAAKLIYVAARLGVADVLAAGPLSGDVVATRLAAHPPTMHRMLRGWTACGLLNECEDGRFELTGHGQTLRRDAPGTHWYSVMEWGDVIDRAMAGLPAAIKDGGTPFEHEFGMSVWQYRDSQAPVGERFHANVAAASARIAGAVAAACDFAQASLVIDVGGGRGGLLAGVLQAHPHLRGMVFEKYAEGTQDYIAGCGLAERCEVRAGDFFAGVPAGGDVYLLKAIVHDWNDGEAARILANCRSAMAPGSRLLLVERAMPERAVAGSEAVFSDILMLLLEHGRERTEAEFRALLAGAGFSQVRRLPLAMDDACLLEACA